MIGMLRRERSFSVLLGGNLLSQIGDGIHEFIFIITALQITHDDVVRAGVIYFFRFIPYLILGPLGGALSDRLSRRSLMVFADLSRMLITGIFCVLLIIGRVDYISLALIGMLMTAFRTLFQPAFQGTIPLIVSADCLPEANGATQMAAEMGGVVGPALGGLMLASTGHSGYVILADVVTYLISTVCVLVATRASSCGDVQSNLAPLTLASLYGDFGSNLRAAMRRRELFLTIGFSALCIFFVGSALRILIPAMLKEVGYGDSVVGYAMSFIASGALVGAILCSKVMRSFDTKNLMVYWSIYGIALAILPILVTNLPAIFAGCFVLGGVGAFVDVILPTNIQSLSTNNNVGKNFSLFSTLANTGEALSGGFAGVLTLFASVGVSLFILGALIASVGYLGKHKAMVQHE